MERRKKVVRVVCIVLACLMALTLIAPVAATVFAEDQTPADKLEQAKQELEAIENEIDARRKRLIKEHVQRLGSGECRPESSSVFVNLVCNLERVGDHLNYIAHSSEAN